MRCPNQFVKSRDEANMLPAFDLAETGMPGQFYGVNMPDHAEPPAPVPHTPVLRRERLGDGKVGVTLDEAYLGN